MPTININSTILKLCQTFKNSFSVTQNQKKRVTYLSRLLWVSSLIIVIQSFVVPIFYYRSKRWKKWTPCESCAFIFQFYPIRMLENSFIDQRLSLVRQFLIKHQRWSTMVCSVFIVHFDAFPLAGAITTWNVCSLTISTKNKKLCS